MRLVRISGEEYARIFPSPSHVYDSVVFTELNAHKCEEIHYLVAVDERGKTRLGIILGQRDRLLSSPFSAPFGGVEQTRPQRIEYYLEFVDALRLYASALDMKVRLTLPPMLYDRDGNVAKLYCALLSRGATLAYTDYNYHFPTHGFGRYVESLASADRKKFRKSERAGFRFDVLGGSREDIERVYDVIRQNRESHGYELKMSLEDVVRTAGVVSATFMVMSLGGKDVAAVLAYDVVPGIVQIIYWGDVPGFSDEKPMRLLPYKVFGYLSERASIVDVGPSSIDGVPGVGLCNFKEEVGCVLSPKPTFYL